MNPWTDGVPETEGFYWAHWEDEPNPVLIRIYKAWRCADWQDTQPGWELWCSGPNCNGWHKLWSEYKECVSKFAPAVPPEDE